MLLDSRPAFGDNAAYKAGMAPLLLKGDGNRFITDPDKMFYSMKVHSPEQVPAPPCPCLCPWPCPACPMLRSGCDMPQGVMVQTMMNGLPNTTVAPVDWNAVFNPKALEKLKLDRVPVQDKMYYVGNLYALKDKLETSLGFKVDYVKNAFGGEMGATILPAVSADVAEETMKEWGWQITYFDGLDEDDAEEEEDEAELPVDATEPRLEPELAVADNVMAVTPPGSRRLRKQVIRDD